MEKAVISAQVKLGEIWQFDVQKGGWGHPSHLLETSYIFSVCHLFCEFRLVFWVCGLHTIMWAKELILLWFSFFFFFLLPLNPQGPGTKLQPPCSFTSWKYTCRSNSTTLWCLSETIHLIKFAGYYSAGKTNVVWGNTSLIYISSSTTTVESLFLFNNWYVLTFLFASTQSLKVAYTQTKSDHSCWIPSASTKLPSLVLWMFCLN